jgi:multidrug efflux pump subunit AcrA (membrane-fusion protein)
MTRRVITTLGLVVIVATLAGWGVFRVYRASASVQALTAPTTAVKRGDVTVSVAAKGELHGGNSEMLIAPMTGAREMIITYLRQPGELVKDGETVVEFDTTEQDFALKEAEADLAEAEQQVIQAQAETDAREEETRTLLVQAQADVQVAELEARKNPLLARIAARLNTLAVEAARDRLRQLEQDLASRKKTSQAAIAIQEAARQKAKVKADIARRNIQSMTLKAKSAGYVAVQQNTNSNFFMMGMQLPIFQLGDMVRAGMAVAQIPDMKSWEVTSRIGELDRGHLAVGQPAQIGVVALPGRTFQGKIKNIGGTTGPPWDRYFECKIGMDDPAPELRAGMSARIVITTQKLPNVLWLPSQALFESDGRTFVYARSGGTFTPADVKLVRRSESQVVITGLKEGQMVAMASPDQLAKKDRRSGGAMKALGK